MPLLSHNRSKSSLSTLTRLRRKEGKEGDQYNSDGASLSTQPTRTSSTVSINMSHANSGHGQKPSTGTAGLTKMQPGSSFQPARPATSASQDKGVSIEQSVRKFRIFEALRNGDTAAISKAIRESDGHRMSTSSVTTSGIQTTMEDSSILHLAVQCAEIPVVEYVISDGTGTIDINARDKDGNTALHLAAQQGRGPIVRLLLEQPDINDSLPNFQGKVPLDLARTPDIFQQLQLSRSLFADAKIKEVQGLVVQGNYKRLCEVLEEPRVKTVLDINGGEFASDITTIQSGGTLLHEAARRRNKELIQVLLLHGADPFRRDRRGKLPQDVTKDDATRAMLKKSPAAVAAQRGIQEKAVLGNASQQGAASIVPSDALAAKDGREMKGYLKKWTNYRKGYQLRWFVLEDGVMSYYKHQDDTGSACRGAINMRIAKLNMDPTEKTKFDILGKSSVKYHLKANHEVEAKRWFWALNNSIQWTKDQAKEEDKLRERSAELLQQAKAEHTGVSKKPWALDDYSETNSLAEQRRNSSQVSQLGPQSSTGRLSGPKVAFTSAGSVDEDEGTAYGSYEPSVTGGEIAKVSSHLSAPQDAGDDEEEYGEGSSIREAPASKDAFDITAQSAKLQLEMMSSVNAAFQVEQAKNPNILISDTVAVQAVQSYDSSIANLTNFINDLLKISKDRDAYWQYRVDQEANMRRMWEESMAQVAREQEVLEARVGEAEEKRKITKRALREVIEGGVSVPSRPGSRGEPTVDSGDALERVAPQTDGTTSKRRSTVSSARRKSIMMEVTNLSESESEDDEEFFDAVDAGEVEVAPTLPPSIPPLFKTEVLPQLEVAGVDVSPSFKGYENGIRKRLKMDADDRPKISLWVSYLAMKQSTVVNE
jgi:ankyrin repeat protein